MGKTEKERASCRDGRLGKGDVTLLAGVHAPIYIKRNMHMKKRPHDHHPLDSLLPQRVEKEKKKEKKKKKKKK